MGVWWGSGCGSEMYPMVKPGRVPSKLSPFQLTRYVPYNAHAPSFIPLLSAAGLKDGSNDFLDGKPAWRMFLYTQRFEDEWENRLPFFVNEVPDLPCEAQVEDEIRAFCEGNYYINPRDAHAVQPVTLGVWELKTPDVRIYGWFIQKDLFVAHVLESAKATHAPGVGYAHVTNIANAVNRHAQSLPTPFSSQITKVSLRDVLTDSH